MDVDSTERYTSTNRVVSLRDVRGQIMKRLRYWWSGPVVALLALAVLLGNGTPLHPGSGSSGQVPTLAGNADPPVPPLLLHVRAYF